ncbi:MAG: glycosyltransferase family 4 protein [Lentimicrobiaceae bacterium]|nr:glycosyltransferase family 4 protein [Lentimicrobiaceae bacterium]
MTYILHIPSWFPDDLNPYCGNFIEKHVSAIALRHRCITLRIIPKTQPEKKIEFIESENHTIVNGYCKKYSQLPLKIFTKIEKVYLYHKAVKAIVKKYGKPDFIHLHVALPMGNFAKSLSKKWNIPLVLTEHWTIYQPQNKEKLTPALHRKLSKIYESVTAFSTVSENLQQLITQQFNHQNSMIIPNVVDIDKFKLGYSQNEKKTIIHISTLIEEAKNFTGILKAIQILSQKREDFILKVIHENRNITAEAFVSENHLNEKVIFLGSKNEEEVAHELEQSDFLLLFSNYENLPCVIIEAFACGKPVVTTNVGGISEIVDESRGIFVTTKDYHELAEKLDYMLDHHQEYNPAEIREYAEKNFSREAISKQFDKFYRN